MAWELNKIDLWRSRTAVGVTLGAGGVSGLKLVKTGQNVTVADSKRIDLPTELELEPPALESALRQVAAELIDEQARLVANIRSPEADLHFFDVPFNRPDKVRRVLTYSAEPYFLAPVEELLFDYLPLPSPGTDGRQGLILGAKPEEVATVLNNFHLAGLDPKQVLPDRLGLLSAGRYLFRDRTEPRFKLLLDLGAGQTGLALFDQDRPILTRSIFFGGRDMTQALASDQNLDWSTAESLKRETDLTGPESPARTILTRAWGFLVQEIERTLASGLSEPPQEPPLMVLGGGGALTPGLAGFLSARLGIEVELLENPASCPGLLPNMLCPFGLAWQALSPGYQPNLRQGDLAPRQILIKYRRPLSLIAAGLILTLLLNLGGLIYAYRFESQRYKSVKFEMERLFKETVPGVTKVVEPLPQLKQEVDKLSGSTAGAGLEGGTVLDILFEVSRLAGSHKGLRLTDLAITRQSVELAGEGESYEVIDLLKTELTGLPYFSGTTLGGARVDPTTRVLTFKLSLKRKTG